MSGAGLHHVTAISGPGRRNVGFYTGVLGLRLVKKTVNFDDPTTYHLYYGNGTADPGTILTFFPWEHAAPGHLGVGETQETAFRVPEGSIGFWTHRLVEKGIAHEVTRPFGETTISFKDPDGMRIALVAVPGIEAEAGWSTGEIDAAQAIRGIHGVSLLLREAAPTGAVLTDVFGFAEVGSDGSTIRYRAEGAAMGGIVYIRAANDAPQGRLGRATVHHIAFRAADDEAQAAMMRRLAENHGIRTTEQTALKLPARYEARRAEIEAALPVLAD